jgi:hypothetical protein
MPHEQYDFGPDNFAEIWQNAQHRRAEDIYSLLSHFFERRRGPIVADQRAEAIWASEIERLARETGFSTDNLRTLEMLGIHGADLLRRRMDILRIDPNGLYDSEPSIFRTLQKSCSACESYKLCALELAQDAIDPTRPDWQDYCPNAATIKMLSATNELCLA